MTGTLEPVRVRAAAPADAGAWLSMRCALWPDGSRDEHAGEIERYFAGELPRGPWIALFAESDAGEPLGFAEVGVRPYAEGCASARVAYLEGWFVAAHARRLGAGRALVRAGEAWGRAQGCTELASDIEPSNAVGERAHLALGFEDAGLVRCFRKDL